MARYFIDTHCHFFSAAHIPISQTLDRIHKSVFGSTWKQTLVAGGATIGGMFAGHYGNELLNKLRHFVRFFDQPAWRNIEEVVTSLREIESLGLPERKAIFTPLLMDFEMCVDHKLLKDQVDDLRDGIGRIADFLEEKNALILPFVGFDMRRFVDVEPENIRGALEAHLDRIGVEIKAFSRDQVDRDARNGDFIGLKLYPSLGSDLYPAGTRPAAQRLREQQGAFAVAVAEMGIPVTVHCQPDSFECGKPGTPAKRLANYANPRKWLSILEQYPEARSIRLNLAHFGGEGAVTSTIRWSSSNDLFADNDGIPKAMGFASTETENPGWTHSIIRMLKQYPNIYSDIGAFGFPASRMTPDEVKKADQAAASLLWLLHYDTRGSTGDISGDHLLKDKLMWGTDIPMTLFDFANYREQFESFAATMNVDEYDSHYELPDSNEELEFAGLFERLVDTNPARFLFGGGL